MEQDAQSFMSVLANFQPVEEDIAALDGWSEDQLKAEVVRLRRALASVTGGVGNLGVVGGGVVNNVPVGGVGNVVGDVNVGVPMVDPLDRMGGENGLVPLHGMQFGAPFLPEQEAGPSEEPPRRRRTLDDGGVGPTRRKPTRHDSETGKRVERGRRIELQRAIRTKMRYMMGIGLEDDLPAPSGEEGFGNHGWVPNWPAGVGDARNGEWLDVVCNSFIAEATTFSSWSKVPAEDLDRDTVKTAARTAFQNFAKRYLAEVDPKQAKKQQKYIKNRRRWARKDLKQKRRAKAASDPAFADIHLPHVALHIDYMSSEYSSAGEDEAESDPLAAQRQSEWMATLNSVEPDQRSGKGGWAEGVSEKVLEVRTPTWRSARLDELYRRLDHISSAQAALRATPASQQALVPSKAGSNPRLGHVAPSHKRFTLPPRLMRRGHGPRDTGEDWMWATGKAGVWPVQEEEQQAERDEREAREAVAAAVESVQAGRDEPLVGQDGLDPSVDALVEGWTEGGGV